MASGSNSSKSLNPSEGLPSTSSGLSKPPTASSRNSRTVASDQGRVDKPTQEPSTKGKKKSTVVSTATRKPADDRPKPPTSQDVRSKPKSPLTASNPTGISDQKPAKKKQKPVPPPVEAESEEEWIGFGANDDEGEGESEDEEPLHGLSSEDDQDSSDEEIDIPGIDISKLPTIAKDDKVLKQKLEKAKRQPVCIACIPSCSV